MWIRNLNGDAIVNLAHCTHLDIDSPPDLDTRQVYYIVAANATNAWVIAQSDTHELAKGYLKQLSSAFNKQLYGSDTL